MDYISFWTLKTKNHRHHPTPPKNNSYVDKVTKNQRRLFDSWRSRGASSGTSSNNHLIISEYPSHITAMATSSGIFKDCIGIAYNESLKAHNNVTFKLIKTGK